MKLFTDLSETRRGYILQNISKVASDNFSGYFAVVTINGYKEEARDWTTITILQFSISRSPEKVYLNPWNYSKNYILLNFRAETL